MRDFQVPGRSLSVGANGMVATSNPQAALVGLDVLRAGGNAVDAAIAVAAMLAVVEPTQTGIGGDCFAMVKKRGELPIALDGAGWAAKRVDISALRANESASISADSVHSVTVPGAVRAWERLALDHGTRSLGELFGPAIAAAEFGYPVTERLARDWSLQVRKISANAAARDLFVPFGSAPSLGDKHVNRCLARALRSIADDGADAFYTGWIAEEIVSLLKTSGGYLRLDDFAEYFPQYVTPISSAYRSYRLWECPPSGQGIVALQMASMFGSFDLSSLNPLSPERFHLQGELSRLAYAQRDALLCDTAFHPVDFAAFLSQKRIAELVSKFDLEHRIENFADVAVPEHKDTVFISVADANGTMVSFINSIYDDFGSGLVAPTCGVLLHNRGCGFVLDEGHPNVIAGRKRPMHTIIPALLTQSDRAVMSFGVTGGHFQPAGQLQVLSNIVDFDMSIQQAIDFPRMFARANSFELERTVPNSVWTGLRRRGHSPKLAENPLGTCHAIWADCTRGVFLGGSDGRRDGIAIGY